MQSPAAYDRRVMAKAAHIYFERSSPLLAISPPWRGQLMRSRAQLATENLFLRKQLARYQERRAKPRRADDATRIVLAGLSRLLEWRQFLVIVKPETLIRWHRKGFRLFWRWQSRAAGRPRIAADVQRLIATMAAANRTWGEERIANELLLKLGIRVSPRTVSGTPVATASPKPGHASLEHVCAKPRRLRARE